MENELDPGKTRMRPRFKMYALYAVVFTLFKLTHLIDSSWFWISFVLWIEPVFYMGLGMLAILLGLAMTGRAGWVGAKRTLSQRLDQLLTKVEQRY